jgi:hypothetical protein
MTEVMSDGNGISTVTLDAVAAVGQQLQKRRENWKRTLDALPLPKVQIAEFPYANMDQAIRNDFKLFDGGKDQAFALLLKGFKYSAWHRGATKNRATRDAIADGEVPVTIVKRMRKARAKKAEAAKAEAA